MVFGSVGFNGWFEFGGKDWKLKDFEKRHTPGTISWDAHAWLEDEEGNIYDYIFDDYDAIARIRTHKKLKHTGIIEGKSKKWCKDHGLTYVAAEQEVKIAIFLSMFEVLLSIEEELLSGNAEWIPGGGLFCKRPSKAAFAKI